MSKLPVVSGKRLLEFLRDHMKYEIVRQKGSHVRLRKNTIHGEHNITVPLHKEIAKGTLNDILNSIALWNGISKEKLIDMIRKG